MGVRVEIRVPQEYPPYCIALLETLFADNVVAAVTKHFTEGQSGTFVFLVESMRQAGEKELPVVVKIGPSHLLQQEWRAAQDHIASRLPDFVPISGQLASVTVTAKDGSTAVYSAVRYQLAGSGIFAIETLRNYALAASPAALWTVLEKRLFQQLDRIWNTTNAPVRRRLSATYDRVLPVNLLLELAETATPLTVQLDATQDPASYPQLQVDDWVQLHNFVVTEIDAADRSLTLNLPQPEGLRAYAYRLRIRHVANLEQYNLHETVGSLTGRVVKTRHMLLQDAIRNVLPATVDLTQPLLHLPETNEPLPNPLLHWSALLQEQVVMRIGTVHGDLNAGNVLVDVEAKTTFLIDCAHAHRDHALVDLARLESELLLHLVAARFFELQLPPTTIYELYDWLDYVTRREPNPPGFFSLPQPLLQTMPQLQSAFIALTTIRNQARQYLAVREQWYEYYAALTLTLLGSLKFTSLDRATAGMNPKAIAFWGAATLLARLEQPAQLLHIGWQQIAVDEVAAQQPVSGGAQSNVTIDYGDAVNTTNFHGPVIGPIHTGSGHIYVSETARAASKSQTAGGGSKGTEPPNREPSDYAFSDGFPSRRRLDVGTPEQATLDRAFSLAVAVRQLTSPPLALTDLPAIHSGNAQLDWPKEIPFVRVRIQVIAPECEIGDGSTQSIKLYRNLDSEVFYFSLIPKAKGRLSIIVRLYQEEDMLGSTIAHTTVSEQMVSEVKLQLRSDVVTVKDDVGITNRTASPPPAKPKIKILFLTANPLDTVRLRTGEEAHAIDQALRQAEYRIFDIAVHQAVRINDLQDLLLRHRPDIVHFSGHGSAAHELILQDANGNATPVSGKALRALFGVLKDKIRCVVLNACYTEGQALSLAEVIDCVVGISDDITDQASIQFATAFYRALGYGRSVEEAFSLGQVQIELARLEGRMALHLHGAAASQTRFAGEPPTNAYSQQYPSPKTDYEDRRLDAAMPSKCSLNQRTEVRVLISTSSSEGLKQFLPDYTKEGYLINKQDVEASPPAPIEFSIDPVTGRIQNTTIYLKLVAPDFKIDQDIVYIQILPNQDSGMVTFHLTPVSQPGLGRVKVELYNKNKLLLTSVSLATEIVLTPIDLITQIVWQYLSVMIGINTKEALFGTSATSPQNRKDIHNETAKQNALQQSVTWYIPFIRWGIVIGGIVGVIIAGAFVIQRNLIDITLPLSTPTAIAANVPTVAVAVNPITPPTVLAMFTPTATSAVTRLSVARAAPGAHRYFIEGPDLVNYELNQLVAIYGQDAAGLESDVAVAFVVDKNVGNLIVQVLFQNEDYPLDSLAALQLDDRLDNVDLASMTPIEGSFVGFMLNDGTVRLVPNTPVKAGDHLEAVQLTQGGDTLPFSDEPRILQITSIGSNGSIARVSSAAGLPPLGTLLVLPIESPTTTPSPTPSPTQVVTPTTTATPTPEPHVDLPIYESFDGVVKLTWENARGEWGVNNQRLQIRRFGNGLAAILIAHPKWKRYAVELDFGTIKHLDDSGNVNVPFSNFHLLIHFQGNTDGYWFTVANGGVACTSYQKDIGTQLTPSTNQWGEMFDLLARKYTGDHKLKITVRDNLYTFTLDDEEICSFRDNTYPEGSLGVVVSEGASGRMWIDNVRISPLD